MGYLLGVDVGGTFTDFLLMSEQGTWEVFKVPTTPADPAIGFMIGLEEIARRKGMESREFVSSLGTIVHGTTVTTNCLLTRTGAVTGLLTTKGFRDALQMRRGMREELYNNKYVAPEPLVPRYLRLPIDERADYKGENCFPVDGQDVRQRVGELKRHGVESVAICFMHSYANHANERLAADLVRQEMPDVFVTVSSELLPQVRFFDRLSTTCISAYVGPVLRKYLTSLIEKLDVAGFEGVLLIMQSNGGIARPSTAVSKAASTVLSGPAAGPVAGVFFASSRGHADCITVDMGGTSFDATLIKSQSPLVTTEGRIDRLLLALPSVNVHSIGSGGGSIAWIDSGGLLHMGPQTAGAVPGPACYGLGGDQPTCTDADLLLGYLNQEYFLGGRIKLDYQQAREAVAQKIAKSLNLDVIEAAAGMYKVINENMTAGIRAITVDKGFDPRDFPLVVGGGAGPLHAGMIALNLDIPLIIIPREPSVFCATGLLLSDLKHDLVRTYHCAFKDVDESKFWGLMEEMASEGESLLISENIGPAAIRRLYSCDMRYVGQHHDVNVILDEGDVLEGNLESVLDKFHHAHDRLYGYSIPNAPTDLMNLRVTVMGRGARPAFVEEPYQGQDASAAYKGNRGSVYLLKDKLVQKDVPVFEGDRLVNGNNIDGPAIVEQPTTTIFVPPEYGLACDKYGNRVMYLLARANEYKPKEAEPSKCMA
ncbi:MAG: hydantoinase/oxoprolinase family protein [Chloroflexota bacterium]|nr:MAG: hydantoinase/oxoprolinase family protein [Chloroflexota bacterium]